MLVEFEAVKAHLRITTTTEDADLQLKTDAAEAAIVRYVSKSANGKTVVETWTDPTATPKDVQIAVLFQVAEFYRFRGDDPGAAIYSAGRDFDHDLSPVVLGLLRRFTDPVIA